MWWPFACQGGTPGVAEYIIKTALLVAMQQYEDCEGI